MSDLPNQDQFKKGAGPPRGRFINSLSAKLFRYIFGAYFAVTLAVTAVQLAIEYSHVKRNILNDLRSLAETFQPVLSESLWTFNDDSLNTTLFSMLKLESVIGVKIFNEKGELLRTVGVENKDSKEIKNKSFLSKDIYQFEVPLTFKNPDGIAQSIGKAVLISGSGVVINKLKYGFILIIINSVFKTTALWLIFVFFLKRIVSQPLARLTKSVNNFDLEHPAGTEEHFQNISSQSDEIGILSKKFGEMWRNTVEMMDKLKEQSRLQAIAQLARQVAHDIRSPLAALNVVTSMVSDLPEDKRLFIRSAVHRIDDIANELISRSKPITEDENAEQKGEITIHLLSGVIEAIVSEKRLQFRTKRNITLDFQIATENYGLFARINPVTIKRILSNLINNSVEAIERADGKINIGLISEGDNVILSVTDNGKGITSDVLPLLMKEGASFGKTEGNGIGLYHASETIKSWDGRVEIKSTLGAGTVVRIILPRAPEPNWFVQQLIMPEKGTIIILDDDDSIHEIWKQRFNKKVFQGLEILHFKDPESTLIWYSAMGSKSDIVLGLFDYELIGHELTGLDVIDRLGFFDKSILVTSRFDEDQIRQTCIDKAVRMIPKSLAGFVPLSAKSKELPSSHLEYVLIDDCPITRGNWEITARVMGKRLATFGHPDHFMKTIDSVPKDTKLYVDVNLSDGIRGEDVSRELHAKGFTNIYLATGAQPDEFKNLWWIKAVIGKDPPFLPAVKYS